MTYQDAAKDPKFFLAWRDGFKSHLTKATNTTCAVFLPLSKFPVLPFQCFLLIPLVFQWAGWVEELHLLALTVQYDTAFESGSLCPPHYRVIFRQQLGQELMTISVQRAH